MISQQYYHSPLRYPGGKSSLYDFLLKTIKLNELQNNIYAEAFAGGAGAALKLLMLEHVNEIILNDLDPFIFNFWKSILKHNDELVKLISDTPVTYDEWVKRKQILKSPSIQSELTPVELGFTAFFLNRCNRSGILTSGPIGGNGQEGKWKLDARYNKAELIKRIQRIGFYADRIKLYNLDAIAFIRKLKRSPNVDLSRVLIYLDPPYVANGFQLYRFHFENKDHTKFAKFIQRQQDIKWIISYDDDPLIHQLYRSSRKNILEFNYFANRTKVGRELIISSNPCRIPHSFVQYSKNKSATEESPQLSLFANS